MAIAGGVGNVPITTPVTWDPDWSHGNTDRFGAADYVEALFGVKGQGKQALMNRRRDVLSWLDKNQSMLHESNRAGVVGGLHDRIARGDIESRWLRDPHKTTGEVGGRVNFGTADYLHALASGKSNQEILDWTGDAGNAVQWGQGNEPGGSGLHTLIKNKADVEGRDIKLEHQISGIKDQFAEFSAQSAADRAQYSSQFSDAFRQFQQDQADYEQRQSDWRARQASMQQQMQIEQMKAIKSRPAMAIMPNQYGVQGMSAGNLSSKRPKKQVTGLNIR
tara:strand:+ start:1383 stop:2213 length:831 start_codon:yes stop_codon:yes gene_type:complete